MASILKHKSGDPLDLPEYIGPVEIRHYSGRGRGVTATENISPGQLIIVSKALAIVYPDKEHLTSSKLVNDVKKLGALREAVVDLLNSNTESSKLVYQLHAGPELGVLAPEKAPLSEPSVIDMKRIERICSLNGFESHYGAESNGSSYGLWFAPSFLNHDCFDSNAHWSVFQNYMFIRATKKILKNDEVLISYVDPNQSFAVRRKFYLKHEFQCSCKLCKVEKSEGQNIRRRRDILLEDFKDESPQDSEIIQSYIDDLEDLRPTNPELNIFLVQPLVQLGLCFYEKANYAEAAVAFERVCNLCNLSAQFALLRVSCAFTIATCFLRLGNSKEAQRWFDESKSAVVVQYGTLSVAEIIRPSFVTEMKYAGFELKFSDK